MNNNQYTDRDIEIAEKLGALNSSIQHVHDKLDSYLNDQRTQHNALWKKIDTHSDDISKLQSMFQWIIGIGLGFQAAWGILMIWLKKN